MTDHDDAYGWNDVHALSGAYAIDALDDDERTRFAEHLLRCPDCRDEVSSLREAAAALAVQSAMPAPHVRDRVLSGIASIRPLPPLTDTEGAEVTLLAPRRHRRVPWSTLVLAAAVALLVAVGGVLWLRPSDERPAPLTATTTERVLAAEDATRVTQRFEDGSRATVVVSRSEGRAVILTEDMQLAPAGSDYQLWLVDADDRMEPAGLMPDDPDATMLLHGDASQATGIGVTVEPDGGSPQPTTTPIVMFDLEA
ncbi:anti-sigma-K factor RskA [Nocardioides thalensis]|uniref:Regulator of SigK n=1 Tax=Nocardioides thalensis TaxID=1914755 RepID=A0A853C4M8_9ACTN|nr:anti-sigma factor [Nocardioides thalensis]NYJ02239.1 anti-sigma-K factor RskA [Nocardioides thalensis]